MCWDRGTRPCLLIASFFLPFSYRGAGRQWRRYFVPPLLCTAILLRFVAAAYGRSDAGFFAALKVNLGAPVSPTNTVTFVLARERVDGTSRDLEIQMRLPSLLCQPVFSLSLRGYYSMYFYPLLMLSAAIPNVDSV